jgi:YD repeat-containing protein
VKKRIIFVGFVASFLWLAFSGRASATTQNPCSAEIIWVECWMGDNCTSWGWFVVGPGPGGWTLAISAMKCSPPPSCPSCGATGGYPIRLDTGDTYIEQTDVALPGLSGGLVLRRTWHSVWPSNELIGSVGLFGISWRSTFEERVFMDPQNYLTYERGDGSFWTFGLGNFGNTFVVTSPASVWATFVDGGSVLTITFKDGEQRLFDHTTGILTAIIDRNGNTTQLAYDSSGRLATVTDPASRHLYFNYGSSYNSLVTSVTSDFGITLSYAYDTQGRLIQVTKPDLTTVSFTYNALSEITAVTDNNGKILESHSYDSKGRGLTSSQANGVNAVTVTYPPPPPPPPLIGN